MNNNQFKMRVMKYLHSHLLIAKLVHCRHIKCQTMVWSLDREWAPTHLNSFLILNDVASVDLGDPCYWLHCALLPLWVDACKNRHIIVAVNGVSTAGKDIAGVSALIQGKAGTSVSVTVQRPSTQQTLTIKVVRAEINVPSVLMHYIAQDHIADIQMVQFSSGVANQLKNAINQAKKLGATRIILDLRENPGGYLSEAVDTASEFLKSGNVLLEQDSTGHRTPYAVTGDTVDTTDTMVVLVNGDTASAAEIVSGALQDNHRAIIIGEKTFGTGTVLEEFTLSDGSAVLLGTHEWLTPDGHFIRDLGISPNIQVKLNSNVSPLTPTDENSSNMSEQQILSSGDVQLAAAIHYLEKH